MAATPPGAWGTEVGQVWRYLLVAAAVWVLGRWGTKRWGQTETNKWAKARAGTETRENQIEKQALKMWIKCGGEGAAIKDD